MPRLALIAAAGLVLALPASAGSAPARTVRIKGIDFSPRTLVVTPGTSVTWRFLDARTPHNVTSTGTARFKSSPTRQAGTYSVRFTKTGTYAYVCTIHFNMAAKVVVKKG
jgi:plastocyanin